MTSPARCAGQQAPVGDVLPHQRRQVLHEEAVDLVLAPDPPRRAAVLVVDAALRLRRAPASRASRRGTRARRPRCRPARTPPRRSPRAPGTSRGRRRTRRRRRRRSGRGARRASGRGGRGGGRPSSSLACTLPVSQRGLFLSMKSIWHETPKASGSSSMASRSGAMKSGSTTMSLLSMMTVGCRLSRAPRLVAPAKPSLVGSGISRTSGNSAATHSRVSSSLPLSTTMISPPGACRANRFAERRQAHLQQLAAVPGRDDDRHRRVAARRTVAGARGLVGVPCAAEARPEIRREHHEPDGERQRHAQRSPAPKTQGGNGGAARDMRGCDRAGGVRRRAARQTIGAAASRPQTRRLACLGLGELRRRASRDRAARPRARPRCARGSSAGASPAGVAASSSAVPSGSSDEAKSSCSASVADLRQRGRRSPSCCAGRETTRRRPGARRARPSRGSAR